MEKPSPCYDFRFEGAKLDPYQIIEIYGITHPAHQHALKKLLRAGRSIKPLEQDINEIIHALERWKEMNADKIKRENDF